MGIARKSVSIILIYQHKNSTKHVGQKMRTLLGLTTIVTILLIAILLKLLLRIRILNKKIKYVDEANMWHRLAITDDLTGVYNRNAYNIHINDNEKGVNKELRGIVLFDVDDFKMINDTQGHLAGDKVLKNVAKILLEIFREPKYRVFRIGGDEFLVLSIDVSDKEIIERMVALKKRLDVEENISLSKGYSIIKDNYKEAFRYADEMLYVDKLAKKSRR